MNYIIITLQGTDIHRELIKPSSQLGWVICKDDGVIQSTHCKWGLGKTYSHVAAALEVEFCVTQRELVGGMNHVVLVQYHTCIKLTVYLVKTND